MRRLLLCATALALAAPPVAEAEPRKKPKPNASCRTGFVDPRGDHTLGPVPGTEAYDLLGGDVTLGRKELVAVLRLAAAPAEAPQHRNAAWQLVASAGGVRFEFTVRRGATGALASSVTVAGTPVQHRVDATSSTVVWRARWQGGLLRRPRLAVSSLAAVTSFGGVELDSAATDRTAKCA